jgi:hypothetical protein
MKQYEELREKHKSLEERQRKSSSSSENSIEGDERTKIQN